MNEGLGLYKSDVTMKRHAFNDSETIFEEIRLSDVTAMIVQYFNIFKLSSECL